MRPSGELWDEALGCVPGGRGDVRQVAGLDGGANATWRVDTAQGAFVVRLHGDWTHTAGVDRRREAQLHRAAAQAGLAPAIIAADPAGRFLVTEFAAGDVWQAQDLGNPARLARLARQLGELHALPVPQVAPWSLGSLVAAHAERLTAGAGSAAPLAPMLYRAQAILAETAAARPPCIVHNDVNHANLLGPDPVLVDWEYAAVADPLSELACLLAYYPEAAPHLPLLLAESGLSAAHADPLRDLAWVYTLVSWLWYQRYDLAGGIRPAERAAMEALRRRLG